MISTFIGDIYGNMLGFNRNTSLTNLSKSNMYSFYSDDSILTMATYKALTEAHLEDDEDVKNHFIDEYKNFYFADSLRAYGGSFVKWCKSDSREPYNSYANGSAMRVSPVVFFSSSLVQCQRLAKLSSIVTHNHPEGLKGEKKNKRCIYLAKDNKSKEEIYSYITDKYYPELLDREFLKENILKFTSAAKITVPLAIAIFLNSKSYKDIFHYIKYVYDKDTILAMSLDIGEVYYKDEVLPFISQFIPYIPDKYIDILKKMYENQDRIKNLLEKKSI